MVALFVVGRCNRRFVGATLIGANLPDGVLVRTFSWWLAEMTPDILRGGKQRVHVWLGSDGFNERLDNEA